MHDKPVDPKDKNIKAWVLEIISTMKSVVKLEHSFKEQLQTALTQVRAFPPRAFILGRQLQHVQPL